MENSQSFDTFSDSAEPFSTLVPFLYRFAYQMDTDTYESLLASTKQALSSNLRKEPQHAALFNTLLKDCGTCINQSLYLITEALSEAEIYIDKLSKHLSDAVLLLQMLSNFIKMVVEILSMKCCEMKTFPTTTGMIILAVFTHCKESETLYGSNIVNVEDELKDLFRNCHELQLTYLMVLEKHFQFDFTENEQKDILCDALDINLKIGEIVQSIDVKTMAVQWKAYTTICEKYSDMLSDTNTFEDCMLILCNMIKRNIQTIIQEEDNKIMLRSLKVANFMLKILVKECNIFKHATRKNYEHIISLLFYINETRYIHLEMTADRSQFVNLVVNTSECLLKELLSDATFANSLLNLDKVTQQDTFLGFALTIATLMECLTLNLRCQTITKIKLISCLYDVLPQCTRYFCNVDLTLSSDPSPKSLGLFEHLLIRTVALAFTLTSEEYSLLERIMAEAILGIDCASALFSANLWTLLLMAINVNPQLLFNQIVWLCTMYKKLEKHRMFNRSPQKLHLSYTIGRLFDLMENDDKMKICKQFRIHDDDNLSLWAALGVKSLPKEAETAAEEVLTDKLRTQFQCLRSSNNAEDMEKLTILMSVASTCTFANTRAIEDYIMEAWSKTCLKHQFVIQDIDAGTIWFYDYLQALVSLTDSIWLKLSLKYVNVVKILHFVTGIILKCGVEFKLLFIDILCKLAACDTCHSKHADENFTEAFTYLSQDSENVRNKLFITLKQYRHDRNIDGILSTIENSALRETWFKIKGEQDFSESRDDSKYISIKYIHKCFDSKKNVSSNVCVVSESNKASSGNFEFADNVDSLFANDIECDFEEPACKRVKLDSSEAEAIMKRLENDAALLCTMKENVSTAEFRSRIQIVCDELRNIMY